MFRKLLVIISMICCAPIYSVVAMDECEEYITINKKLVFFKLGLELQESSGLCKWALHDLRFQKKPVFKIYKILDEKIINPTWEQLRDIFFIKEIFYSIGLANSDSYRECISFYCKNNVKNLFHVEIDGSDIEFVLNAFTNIEREYLKICAEGVVFSLNILKTILNNPDNILKTTKFKIFIN